MRLLFIPAAAALALLAACQPAPEPYRVRVVKADAPAIPARCAADSPGNCTRVASYRQVYGWRYARPGIGNRADAGPGASCHPRLRTVGEEATSKEAAQVAAQRAWMGSIRFDYGERYMDLSLARDVRHTCVPSAAAGEIKSAMFRCVVEATPCRAAAGHD
jgi:hypothetical protein